jgi:hypothetical protein
MSYFHYLSNEVRGKAERRGGKFVDLSSQSGGAYTAALSRRGFPHWRPRQVPLRYAFLRGACGCRLGQFLKGSLHGTYDFPLRTSGLQEDP